MDRARLPACPSTCHPMSPAFTAITTTGRTTCSFLAQLVGLVLNGGRLEIPPRERLPGADTPHFQAGCGRRNH